MPKRIIIVDNQDITHAGLLHYVMTAFATTQIDEACNKKELTEHLLTSDDAVVVLDYTNTGFNSTDELINLSCKFERTHWILFSNELSEPFVKKMSFYESFSMVLKDSTANEILDALRYALSNERYLCHHIANMLIASTHKEEIVLSLTQTELDVLKQIALGKTVKEIAQMRNSSYHTIVAHKKNIFRKLEVNTIYEATKYALKAGLMEMVEYYI